VRIELLKKDHQKAKDLFEQAEETEQENNKKSKMFPQVCELLDDETLEKIGRQFEVAKGTRSNCLMPYEVP
jgi:predicted house-cleaning noncanonical NTP pyrophosphatase (MazG superfamily)